MGIEPVPRELLDALAGEVPAVPSNGHAPATRPTIDSASRSPRLKVAEYLADRGVNCRLKPEPGKDGQAIYPLDCCVFDASHTGMDAAVMQFPNGKPAYKCFHNSCSGRKITDVFSLLGKPDPHHYDPPLTPQKRRRKPVQSMTRAESINELTEGEPAASNDAGSDDDGPTGYDLILQHFREKYDPIFRRGNVLFSGRLGREVKAGEACLAPGKDLAALLLTAIDCPATEGAPKRSAVPKFFRDWAPSAWKDLLDHLPDEEQAGEVSGLAEEQFRDVLAKGLKRTVTLGFERDGEQRREQRSLIDWCCMFAEAGPWKNVRSYDIWCRMERDTNRFCVALRVALFSQIGYGFLAAMTQKKFSALCELYGCGQACKVAGGDKRAVELTTDYIATLLAAPVVEANTDERTQESLAHARARENGVDSSACTSAGETTR